MSIQYDDIIKDTSSLIRQKSVAVSLPLSQEDKETLVYMYQYVKDSQDHELANANNLRPAVGIAAIQIGVLKKMLAVVVQGEQEGEEYAYALVNPRIISESVQRAYLKSGEGCLSVEDEHKGYVPRAARVSVKGYDILQEKEIIIKAKNYLSIVLQHEIDHFSGTLFYDRINKFDPWKEIPDAIVIE